MIAYKGVWILCKVIKQNDLEQDEDEREDWILGPHPREEIYYKGRTVVWSSGGKTR